MKKGRFRGIFVIFFMLMISLCGCAEGNVLEEKVQTAALEKELLRMQTSTEEENEERPNFLYEAASCFAYQSLSEAEAMWYREIATCLGEMREEVRLDSTGIELGMDETDIDRIFQCVLLDHPELFYVEGYTYQKYTREEKIVALQFSGTYSMGLEEVLKRKAEIEVAANTILAGAAALTDEYDKVKYVYDTIIRNTEYDLEAVDNQNIYSVFVNHKSVCHGYAKAVQYLLERMGVTCALVLGAVDTGEGHAWNLVKVNGSFYYVDATWGDASYRTSGEEGIGDYVPPINYDYLCISTKQLLRTHIMDGYVSMPLCVEEKDNYYVREGAYFTSYDREQMRTVFQRFYEQNKSDVTVKCADVTCFRQMVKAMVEEQEIFDYFPLYSDRIVYTYNEKQLSMTFWVTNE